MALALALPGVLMVALASCGSSSRTASGVLAIAVTNLGGRLGGLSSSSPLPDGFGLGQMTIGGSGLPARKLVVEPYPFGGVTIMVRATDGPEVGKVVARVNLKVGQDIIRVTLAPGNYFIFSRGWASLGTTVTVHRGHYTRAVIVAGLRH